MDYGMIQGGKFTSDGLKKTLVLPAGVDYFECINTTQMATQQATGRGVKFEWYQGFAADSAIEYKKTNSTDALNGVVVTSGGVTVVDSSQQAPLAEKTGSAITAASPAVATINSHGYKNGDVVRIYGSTGMLQIAGMDFTIGSVATNTFELSFLDASGFAAAATAVKARKIPYQPLFYPRNRYITKITAASSAVVTLSVTHGFTVGQKVRFIVPSAFGMSEIDGLIGEVTAISTASNTITVDIDSSAFTAFAFPASGTVPFTFAQVVPVGENNAFLDGAVRNVGFIGLELAAGAQSPAGSSGDVIYLRAYKLGAY